MESEMENYESRIPKFREIDTNEGAQKGAFALNTVSKVLRIADLSTFESTKYTGRYINT